MKPKKFSFPILRSAHLEDNWILWIRVKDLPLDFPLDPNARYPDISKKIPRAIENTLTTEPEEFLRRNSGLCLVARSCEIATGGHAATLSMLGTRENEDTDEVKHGDGVINGGHTYAVIRSVMHAREELGISGMSNGATGTGGGVSKTASTEPVAVSAATAATAVPNGKVIDVAETPVQSVVVSSGPVLTDPTEIAVIRVEVQTGVREDDLADISRARNSAVPVQEISLRNLGNAWAPIKHILRDKDRKRFAFMENDPEAVTAPHETSEYDVGDLVRLLVLFNSNLYPFEPVEGDKRTRAKDPVAGFSSEKALINRWRVDDFVLILPMLREFMNLHDAVALEFPKHMGRNPALYSGVEAVSEDSKYLLMGGASANFRIPISFVFPVVAALRVFLDTSSASGKAKWLVDPKSLAGAAGVVSILVRDALRLYKDSGKSSVAFFGRNKQVWENLRMRALILKSKMLRVGATGEARGETRGRAEAKSVA